MEPLKCDVVGCIQIAAWARVAGIGPGREDFLCQTCVTKLHSGIDLGDDTVVRFKPPDIRRKKKVLYGRR